MNMQHKNNNGYEEKEKRFGYCKFDIDPFAVDLTGTLKTTVYRKDSPEDIPDTIIACDEDWYVKVEWDLQGRLLHHLCGYFCVCVYLERIGPGEDINLPCDGDDQPCIQRIEMNPCGNGHYEVKCDVPKNSVDCGDCGTLYMVAVTLTSFDPCDGPGHIRAYCKGPTLMFYKPPHQDEVPIGATVSIEDNVFVPFNVTIAGGQKVRWIHNGALPHTVTSNPGPSGCTPPSTESFISGTLATGNTFEHTFNTPGNFAYHCAIHGCTMAGTVTVT